jgi:acyl-CoA dehydrogenase
MSATNEVRTLLVDTAERLFADHCSQACVEDAKRTGWASALWQVLAQTQLNLLSIPEAGGGAGGTLTDLAAVLRIAGRYCAPVPLAENALLAGWMLSGSGLPIPANPVAVGPAGRDPMPQLERVAAGWRLNASMQRVAWARIAGHLALLADHRGAVHVALVDTSRCQVSPGWNIAWEPRDDVNIVDLPLEAKHVAPAGPGITRSALFERGALARSVLMVGALDRALELAIAHAKTRVQFGRPIASFQAIQQELARFADEVAAAAAAALSAVGELERAEPGIAVACAKLRVGEAASAGAAIAHQVHAAIGVTQEYALHHATLRLQAWRSEYGSELEWSERLGERILAAGADRLWATLSDTDSPAGA